MLACMIFFFFEIDSLPQQEWSWYLLLLHAQGVRASELPIASCSTTSPPEEPRKTTAGCEKAQLTLMDRLTFFFFFLIS